MCIQRKVGKRMRSRRARRDYYITSPKYETVGATRTLILVSVQRALENV